MSWFGRREDVQGKSDAELMEGVRRRSEACWKEIFRRHHGPVYRYALRMSGSAEAAADAVQDAFLLLVEQPGRFDPSLGSLGGWLVGVARKRVLKYPPAAGEAGPADVALEGDSALEALTREEAREAVREAVNALPEAYREVVLLVEFEEMAYEDAAVALEVPVGTVRSRLHRARALLAAALAGKRRVAL